MIRFYKIPLFILLILFFCISLSAQYSTEGPGDYGSLSRDSKPSVVTRENKVAELVLSSPVVGLNSLFYVYLYIQTKDSSKVKIDYPTDLDYVALYKPPQLIVQNWRNRTYRVRIRYRAKKVGRYAFEGFLVQTIESDYSVAPVLLEIGSWSKGKVKVPLVYRWKIESSPVYQSSNFKAVVEVLDFPGAIVRSPDIRFDLNESVSLEPVKMDFAVNQKIIVSESFYTMGIQAFLVSPLNSDSVLLPGASIVTTDGVTGRLEPFSVSLKPLPSGFSKAIGEQFQYKYQIRNKRLAVGEEVVLMLSLSGTGNFQQKLLPVPTVTGLVPSNIRYFEDFIPVSESYSGYQSTVYKFKPSKVGGYLLEIPSFSWFNIKSGRLEKVSGERLKIQVTEGGAAEDGADSLISYKLFPVSRMNDGENIPLYLQSVNFVLFIPAFLMFVIAVFLYFKRKKEVKMKGLVGFILFFVFSLTLLSAKPFQVELQEAENAFQNENFSEAWNSYYSISDKMNNNSIYCYNASLAAHYAGYKGEAVYYSLRAVYLDPDNFQFRHYVDFLEQEYGLIHQYSMVPALNPTVLFLIIIALVNIAALLFLLFNVLQARRLFFSLFAFCLMMLVVVSIIFTVGLVVRQELPGVVIDDQCSLHKIHSESAAPVFTVSSGTTLKVIGEWNGFYLVRTSLGFDGWVKKDALRLLK